MSLYLIRRKETDLYAIAATEDASGQHIVFGDKTEALPFRFTKLEAENISKKVAGIVLEPISQEESKTRAMNLLKKLANRLS